MALPTLSADIIDGIQTQKNYIRGQVDKNTSGWVGFTDASADRPVDGTGGAAPTVTFAVSTTAPLRDSASFLWTHPASDTRGQGFSYDFTIDRADRYSVLRVGVDYEVKSGTFDFGDSTYADPSDLSFWLFDVTNSLLIELTQPYLNGGKYVSEFQSSDSTSYRLIAFSTTVTATAYTIAFDNFFVGQRDIARGPIDVYMGELTTTGSWVTNTTYTGDYWRRGDKLLAKIKVATSGAPTSASLSINLPTGLTIDTTKTGISTGSAEKFGQAAASDSGTTYSCNVFFLSSTSLLIGYQNATSGTATAVTQAAPFTFGATDFVTLNYEVPIVGWGSNVVTSADSGTRVIAANLYQSAQYSGTSTAVITIPFNTVDFDSAGLFSSADNGFKITEEGFYQAGLNIYLTGGTASDNNALMIRVNGSTVAQQFLSPGASTNAASYSLHKTIKCVAGDVVTAHFQSNTDIVFTIDGVNTGRSFFCIHKVQSPQTIGMADKNVARYSSNAGQSIPNNSASPYTVVDFEDRDFDTMNSVTVGSAWKFTANRAGFIYIMGRWHFAAKSFTAGNIVDAFVFKNGIQYSQFIKEVEATGTLSFSIQIFDVVQVVAGDYVDIRAYQNSGAALTLGAGSEANTVNVWMD